MKLGWDVRDMPGLADEIEAAERKRMKAERKAIRAASIAAIVRANTIDLGRAEEILRSGKRVGAGELASARKTILIDYVGVPEDEIDEGLVTEWVSGKLSRRIETFVAVKAIMAGGETRDAIATRQVRAMAPHLHGTSHVGSRSRDRHRSEEGLRDHP